MKTAMKLAIFTVIMSAGLVADAASVILSVPAQLTQGFYSPTPQSQKAFADHCLPGDVEVSEDGKSVQITSLYSLSLQTEFSEASDVRPNCADASRVEEVSGDKSFIETFSTVCDGQRPVLEERRVWTIDSNHISLDLGFADRHGQRRIKCEWFLQKKQVK